MEGRFPVRARRSPYEIPCKLMRSGPPEVHDPHIVDERKLFYVAATRARDLLIIGTADVVNKRGGGPSTSWKTVLSAVPDGTRREVRPPGRNCAGSSVRSREVISSRGLSIARHAWSSKGFALILKKAQAPERAAEGEHEKLL